MNNSSSNNSKKIPINFVNAVEWKTEEVSKLVSMRLLNVPYSKIGKELNRTSESCRKKYDSLIHKKDFNIDDYIDSSDVSTQEKQFQKNKFADSKKTQLVNAAAVTSAKTDVFVDAITEAIRRNISPDKPVKMTNVYSNKNSEKRGTPEHIGLMLTDLHIGEEFSLEETNGISEYNLDIFKRRMENLKKSMENIYDIHKKCYDIPEIHIFALGDIVAGMNAVGSWSPVYISSSIFDQYTIGAQAIGDFISYCLTMFKRVNFYGILGNHSRTSKPGQEKFYCSWDLVVYEHLRARFMNDPRVSFNVSKSWWSMHEIQNHNFLLVHGDNIKAGSIPAKGLGEFQKTMMSIIKVNPDYTLCGHFHCTAKQTTNNGKVLIGGSFVGGDMFSLKDLHNNSPAEQTIFGIHPKHGITWQYDLNLEHTANK